MTVGFDPFLRVPQTLVLPLHYSHHVRVYPRLSYRLFLYNLGCHVSTPYRGLEENRTLVSASTVQHRSRWTTRPNLEAEGVGLEPTHRVNDTGFQDRGGNQLRFILPIPGLFKECPSKILLFVVVNGIEPLSSGPKPDVLAFILNDYMCPFLHPSPSHLIYFTSLGWVPTN